MLPTNNQQQRLSHCATNIAILYTLHILSASEVSQRHIQYEFLTTLGLYS